MSLQTTVIHATKEGREEEKEEKEGEGGGEDLQPLPFMTLKRPSADGRKRSAFAERQQQQQ